MTKQKKLTVFGEVLKKYRKSAGCTQQQLAEMLGVSRNTVILWENNTVRPDVETIQSIAEITGVPLYELFGLPSMEPDRSEKKIVFLYRQLSPENQKMAQGILKSMVRAEEEQNMASVDTNTYKFVELEPTSAAAGAGCPFGNDKPDYRFVKKNEVNETADALIAVSGRSMEPRYRDGDLVYFRFSSTADDGQDVICTTNDGAVIKHKIGNRLYSLNAEFPYGEKNDDDHVQIEGVVLGIANPADFAQKKDLDALEDAMHDKIADFKEKYGIY